jgi:flagellar basal-body rod protein FlgB
MSNPISSYLGLQADALPLREQRMKLIASNLANADTPGFQARDLDFNAALAAAARTREAGGQSPLRERADHIPLPGADALARVSPPRPAWTATVSTPMPSAPPTAGRRWSTGPR